MLWKSIQAICSCIRKWLVESTCHICPVLRIHTEWRVQATGAEWHNLTSTFRWDPALCVSFTAAPGARQRHLSWIFRKSRDKQSWQPVVSAHCQRFSTSLKRFLSRSNCINKAPNKSFRAPPPCLHLLSWCFQHTVVLTASHYRGCCKRLNGTLSISIRSNIDFTISHSQWWLRFASVGCRVRHCI